jgi:hypothetical protein
MIRQPVFRSYTNIKSRHVMPMHRYIWVIVGSSETGNDKGVEFTIGHKEIDGIDMIKSNVHSIHGTSEPSFPEIRCYRVINPSPHKFPGEFNTKISREIVANPCAIYGCVFQILPAFEEIVPGERIHFNASCLYLGASRQG